MHCLKWKQHILIKNMIEAENPTLDAAYHIIIGKRNIYIIKYINFMLAHFINSC